MESVAIAIVGGGQMGLATSRELTKAGLQHVVLERDRVGETWRNRSDSFCLVAPNWAIQLPDGHYAGGFMPRDEFVAYLERYAAESARRSASTLLSTPWSHLRLAGSCVARR